MKDLDPGLEGILRKFTDDAKLGGSLDSLEGRKALQRDLNKLEGWTITNHVEFSKAKCRIRHLGLGNSECTDRLGNEVLESRATEKDLGILVTGKSAVPWQLGGSAMSWRHQAQYRQPGKGGIVLLCFGAASP
ncbi:hypothetical protein DUI87_04480 [Hirundo rustica rustica]|uniref:Rna-directed dna polymerase from mobile element jockey-like n=1 Tax=Hirundo rustica rustica TaxID=333673 RepID=A0A3M0KZA7_HIRRU|nr:hypothetical protein DUI87_04480 [Hirundo rustica rustica]